MYQVNLEIYWCFTKASFMTLRKARPTPDQFVTGIRAGNRILLGQAITLVESTLPADQELAHTLLERLLPYTGNAIRMGITGVPGVGKSTFIETFGKHITALGKTLAVLTIDPSSRLTGGSILGDKTRMEELSRNPQAFIRPTAAGDALGGVAYRTREAMLLCEAAGYEVIIIETVGVGQSEIAVRNMVDFFLLLMLAGAGDELQGIKKGIMEMADALVITKADGENKKAAQEARGSYTQALHLVAAPAANEWTVPVLTASAITGEGFSDTWATIERYCAHTQASGFFQATRSRQNISWFNDYFQQLLQADLQASVYAIRSDLEQAVARQELSSHEAAQRLLQAYREHRSL
jgi:LAO/AO transport system kinase